jgi:hypothetical protein
MNPILVREPVEWKPRAGINGAGDPSYGPTSTIKIRWDGRNSLIKLENGEIIMSKGRIVCFAMVKPKDVIVRNGEDLSILAVVDRYKASGEFAYNEVYV